MNMTIAIETTGVAEVIVHVVRPSNPITAAVDETRTNIDRRDLIVTGAENTVTVIALVRRARTNTRTIPTQAAIEILKAAPAIGTGLRMMRSTATVIVTGRTAKTGIATTITAARRIDHVRRKMNVDVAATVKQRTTSATTTMTSTVPQDAAEKTASVSATRIVATVPLDLRKNTKMRKRTG